MAAWPILLSFVFATDVLAAREAGAQASRAPVPVEIWTGGDDGLSQRLELAVEEEFRKSSRFVPVRHGAIAGATRVVMPGHAGWRDIGSRTRVTYQLELERDGRRTVLRGGACWETEMHRCARQILRAVEGHR